LPQLSHRPVVAVVVDTGAVVDTAVGLAADTAVGLAPHTAVGLAAAAFAAVDLGVADSAVVRLAASAAGLLDFAGPRLVVASVVRRLAAVSVELGLVASAVQ
jgi:hypothetical protein